MSANEDIFVNIDEKEEDKIEGELAQEQFKLIQGLSNEQVWEIRQAFTHFDKDCSGTISTKELGSLFRALGQNLSDEELLQIIIRVDVDHDGFLDFPEFLWLMARLLSQSRCEDISSECFRVFDTNRSGRIDTHDFREQLRLIYSQQGINEAEVVELFEDLGLTSHSSKTAKNGELRPIASLDDLKTIIKNNDDTSDSSEADEQSTSVYDNTSDKIREELEYCDSSNNKKKKNKRFVTVHDFKRWLQTPSEGGDK